MEGINLKHFQLMIKAVDATASEKEYARQNRDLVMFELCKQKIPTHIAVALFDSFYHKKPVQDSHGCKWYIHEISSHMDWESNICHTRYICRPEKDSVDITSGLVKFSQNDLTPCSE